MTDSHDQAAWAALAQRKTFQAGIVRRPGTLADVLIEEQRKRVEAEKVKSPLCEVAA